MSESDPTALSEGASMESPALPPLLPQDTSIDEDEIYEFAHNYSQEEEDFLKRIATAIKD
jgi:hypothetical protein